MNVAAAVREIDYGDNLDVMRQHTVQGGARQTHETRLHADRGNLPHRRPCALTNADDALLRVVGIEGKQLKQPYDLTRQPLIICCHLFHGVLALQNMSRTIYGLEGQKAQGPCSEKKATGRQEKTDAACNKPRVRQRDNPKKLSDYPGQASTKKQACGGFLKFLCTSSHLHEAQSRGFELGEHALLAVRRQGEVFIYKNRCPHRGIALEWQPDQFLDSSASLIRCAMHGALFLIENGECVAGPCEGQSLTAIQSREDAEGIWVSLPMEDDEG
ncbi:Rieske 2Fe-2S protein [Pseudomonas amygdali pv. mori]|nr:Rieske 2Fe-2S protein [Pseudomonas amygdali pv. mori]